MLVARTVTAVLLCTAIAMAQSGALLSANGAVYVNGLPASSAAMVPGDQVRTGDDAFASITESGSNIVVGKKTSGSMGTHRFIMHQGSASIATRNAYSVEAGPLTVTPQASMARYEVSRLNCRVAVVAHETPLTLSDGSVVRAGQTVTRVEPNCAAGAPAPAATVAGVQGLSKTGAVIGGSAFAAPVVAVVLSSSEPKASPSRPSR